MSATLPLPATPPAPIAREAPALRPAPFASPRSWSPFDAPVYPGSASTRTDKLLYAAMLAFGRPAYVVVSIAGAAGLALGAPIALAWGQRQERRYRDQIAR